MYKDFTSLSSSEEQSFVVYEQTMQQNSKKAMQLGMIVAGVFFVVVMGIVLSGEKPKSRFAEEDGATEELGEEKQEAAKPDPAPAAAPSEPAGEAPAGEAPAGEAPAGEAPAGEAPAATP